YNVFGDGQLRIARLEVQSGEESGGRMPEEMIHESRQPGNVFSHSVSPPDAGFPTHSPPSPPLLRRTNPKSCCQGERVERQKEHRQGGPATRSETGLQGRSSREPLAFPGLPGQWKR